jgi:hypothetical protein
MAGFGDSTHYDQTEAVKIQWENRSTTQQALVVPEASIACDLYGGESYPLSVVKFGIPVNFP